MNPEEQLFQALVDQGLPPGIASEQARAMMAQRNEQNFAYGQVDTNLRNRLADLGINGSLSNVNRGLLDLGAGDISSYASGTSADLLGLDPKYFGEYRGFGGETDLQHAAYIQGLAQALRSQAMSEGKYITLQEAIEVANQIGDNPEVLRARRNVSSVSGSSRAADQAANMGLDVPFGLALGQANSQGLAEDFRQAYGLTSSPERLQFIKANKELLDAYKIADPVAKRVAIAEATKAVSEARFGLNPNLAKATMRSFIPGVTGAVAVGDSLVNNDRGDNWLQNLKRLTRTDPDTAVDAGDYARFGTSAPAQAAAQAYAWYTLPSQVINQMKQSPMGALGRLGPMGSAAINAAGLAPDLAIMGLGGRLGTQRSQYELAKRHYDINRKFEDDALTGTGTAASSKWGDMLNVGRRGLLGRLHNGFDDPNMGLGMKALTLLGDTAQTAGDVIMTPLNAIANAAGTGVGALANAVGAGTSGVGARVRQALTPSEWGSLVAGSRDNNDLKRTISKYEASDDAKTNKDSYVAAKRKSDAAAMQSTLTKNPNAHLMDPDIVAINKRREAAAAQSKIKELERKLSEKQ